jgi:hypothetical protein
MVTKTLVKCPTVVTIKHQKMDSKAGKQVYNCNNKPANAKTL